MPELMNSDENPDTHISNVKNGATNDVAILSNTVLNVKPTTNSLAQMGFRIQNSTTEYSEYYCRSSRNSRGRKAISVERYKSKCVEG